jgi:hypothetical protein
MKCIVCEKPVAGSSNVCSASCLLRAGPLGGKGGKKKGKAAVGLLNDVISKSLEGRPDPWRSVPMIVVKHRWMKDRNHVCGTTVLSFDTEGIARVKDAGNARSDVEIYVRHSKGLAEIGDPAPAAPEPAPKAPEPPPEPAPKPEPPKEVKVEEKPPEVEPEPEPEEEAPPFHLEVEKPTPKKPASRKPPGKPVRKASKKKRKENNDG